VVDRFDGLRHDAIVCRHDQDRDVGDLRASGTHRGEGGVAGSVEERDLPFRKFHLVRTDVLGNASMLLRGDVGLSDVVEQ